MVSIRNSFYTKLIFLKIMLCVIGNCLVAQPAPADEVEQIEDSFEEAVDVTQQVHEEGEYRFDEDWTEVVLFGNRPDQDTVADPCDGDGRALCQCRCPGFGLTFRVVQARSGARRSATLRLPASCGILWTMAR